MSLHRSENSSFAMFRHELDYGMPAFDDKVNAVRPHGPRRDINAENHHRDREIVDAAIERLPELYRTVNRHRDGRGLSAEAVAMPSDMAREKESGLVHRIHCALITLLDPHFKESSDDASCK